MQLAHVCCAVLGVSDTVPAALCFASGRSPVSGVGGCSARIRETKCTKDKLRVNNRFADVLHPD